MSAILRLLILLQCILPALGQSLAGDCKQLMLVTSSDWDQPKAQLQRYEKRGAQWQPVGKPIASILGGAGLAWGLGEDPVPTGGIHKKEGDNRSPAGTYQVTQLWLRKGVPSPRTGSFPVHPIEADTVGVDDPKSRYYNRILKSTNIPQPDWDSWEKMDIPDYDRVLVVAHNLEKPSPGRGSCIFMHRWAAPDKPTSGCTAMAESDLIKVINWLRPDSKPRLVQLTRADAEQWRKRNEIPTDSAMRNSR